MCMSDWLIGKQMRRTIETFTVTNGASVEIATPQPLRTALWIAPPDVVKLHLGINVAAVDGQGLTVQVDGDGLYIWTARHGDLPQQRINAISGAVGTEVVTVISLWLPASFWELIGNASPELNAIIRGVPAPVA